METIALGSIVEWKSQAGGVTKKKRGEVVIVVAPGAPAEMPSGGMDVSIEFDLPAKPRPEESYLVRVENVRKGRAGLYWPPAAKLKPIKGPAAAAPAAADDFMPQYEEPEEGLLPGTPRRGPLAIAAANYLTQASKVKREKAQLTIMGQGVMLAMQTEKKTKLTLEQDGESWRFEVQPSGYHLKVLKSREGGL